MPVCEPSAHSMHATQSLGKFPMDVFDTSVHSETVTPLPKRRMNSVPVCPVLIVAAPRGGPRGWLRSSCHVSHPQLSFRPHRVSTPVQQLEAKKYDRLPPHAGKRKGVTGVGRECHRMSQRSGTLLKIGTGVSGTHGPAPIRKAASCCAQSCSRVALVTSAWEWLACAPNGSLP